MQTGGNVNPRDDVALHLSAVFNPPARIVRNSIQSNRWGAEESFGSFPLSPGSRFEFMLLVEASEYRIAINGSHFTEFRHRLPYEAVSHLAIDGDVHIESIDIDGGSLSSVAPTYAVPPAYGGNQAPYPPAPGLGFDMPYPASAAPPPPPAYSAYPPPAASVPSGAYYPATSGTSGAYHPTSNPIPPPGAAPYYPGASTGPPPPPASSYYPGASSGHPPPPPGSSHTSGGIGGMLSGLTAGVAGTAIGSRLLGKHGKHKHDKHGYPGGHAPHQPGHSSSGVGGIPIAGLAAGAGAAALGTYMLAKANPVSKEQMAISKKTMINFHFYPAKKGKENIQTQAQIWKMVAQRMGKFELKFK